MDKKSDQNWDNILKALLPITKACILQYVCDCIMYQNHSFTHFIIYIFIKRLFHFNKVDIWLFICLSKARKSFCFSSGYESF